MSFSPFSITLYRAAHPTARVAKQDYLKDPIIVHVLRYAAFLSTFGSLRASGPGNVTHLVFYLPQNSSPAPHCLWTLLPRLCPAGLLYSLVQKTRFADTSSEASRYRYFPRLVERRSSEQNFWGRGDRQASETCFSSRLSFSFRYMRFHL